MTRLPALLCHAASLSCPIPVLPDAGVVGFWAASSCSTSLY
jgi:hypothetical protein